MTPSLHVCEVPNNWLKMRLKFVADLNSSGVWGEDSTGVDDYPVITTANIDRFGRINLHDITLRKLSADEASNGLCQIGDIVVVKSSGSATNIISGKAGLVEPSHVPIAFNNFTLRVRAKREVMHPRFLWYFLNSDIVKEQIRIMVATTTYPNLQIDEYSSFLVPLPSRSIQERICEFLDREVCRIDSLITSKEVILGLLAEKRVAIVATATTRGLCQNVQLRESGVPWLGDIPVHWETERSRWLFNERDERSENGEEEMLTVSHLTGVTPRSEKNVNMFEAETNEGYKLCEPGDLVINTLWAWMGAMGTASVTGLVSPAYNVYAPGSRLLPTYIDALVRLPLFAQEVTRYSTGVWSSRLRLYPEGFFEVYLPVPPLDEQRAIVDHTSSEIAKLETISAATERTIALLKERRSALIAAAVTGQLYVGEIT